MSDAAPNAAAGDIELTRIGQGRIMIPSERGYAAADLAEFQARTIADTIVECARVASEGLNGTSAIASIEVELDDLEATLGGLAPYDRSVLVTVSVKG